MMYSMKADKMPKGIKFSFFLMSFPLFATTSYLGMMAPLLGASGVAIDPVNFASLARTCVRLLALNISFVVSSESDL
jgi:hypothetical protein